MGHKHKHRSSSCCKKPTRYCYSYIEAPKWSITNIGTIVPNSSHCFPDYDPCCGAIMKRSKWHPKIKLCCGNGSSCCSSTAW